jgi:hypothetical protein
MEITKKMLLEHLEEMKDYFDSPAKWTTGVHARDIRGNCIYYGSAYVTCRCLQGEMFNTIFQLLLNDAFLYQSLEQTLEKILTNVINDNPFPATLEHKSIVGEKGFMYIPTFNDHSLTTFNDIIKVIDLAIEHVKEMDETETKGDK